MKSINQNIRLISIVADNNIHIKKVKRHIMYALQVLIIICFLNIIINKEAYSAVCALAGYSSQADALCNGPVVTPGGACVDGTNVGFAANISGGCIICDAVPNYRHDFMQFIATTTGIDITLNSYGAPNGIQSASVALLTNSPGGCADATSSCPASGALCLLSCVTSSGYGSVTLSYDDLTIGGVYVIEIQSTAANNGTFQICTSVHCYNGVQDADETDVNCGGVDCPACPPDPGNAYGIYAADAVAGGAVDDCEIYAIGGTGAGSNTYPGGDGIKTSDNGADNGYTNVPVSYFPIINASNYNCQNVNMSFSTPNTISTWNSFDAGSSPASGSGNPQVVTYSSNGRKTINFTGDATPNGPTFSNVIVGAQTVTWNELWNTRCADLREQWVILAANIPGLQNGDIITGISTYATSVKCKGVATGLKIRMKNSAATTSSTFDNAGYTNCYSGSKYLFATGWYDHYFTTPFTYTGTNIVMDFTMNMTTSLCSSTSIQNFWWHWTAGSNRSCYALWTADIGDPQTQVGGTADVDIPYMKIYYKRSVGNLSQPVDYTGFVYIQMPLPSPGSILGAPSGPGCPTTYTYTSSVAGTPGYTYSWSNAAPPPGGSVTIANPAGSSTDITFVNSTAGNLDFTIYLNITSECCGPLTQVQRVITIYPGPDAPIVAASPYSVCAGGSITLSVSAPDPVAGYSYDWYNAPTGGSLLGSGSSYTVSSAPSGATSYYVQATNSSNCKSPRTEVVLNGTAYSPPTTNAPSRCNPGDITITVTNPVSGATYNWYGDAGCTNLLQSGGGISYDVNVPTTPSSVSVYVLVIAPGCGPSAATTATATTTGTGGTTTTWKGTTNNNWFVDNNWTNCVPTEFVDAIFPTILPTGGVECTITFANAMAYGATEAKAKKVLIATGRTLTFGDTKAILEVYGDWIQQGSIAMVDQGTVVMSGSSAQAMTTSAANGAFNELKINNSSGTTPQVTVGQGTGETSTVFSNLTDVVIPKSCALTCVSTIAVSGTGLISTANIRVTVNIAHTKENIIAAWLTAPNGKILNLVMQEGSTLGFGFVNTVFMDGAPTIVGKTSPFTGEYSPEGTLATLCTTTGNVSTFAAIDPNGGTFDPTGNWTLLVVASAATAGTLLDWSIKFPDCPITVTGDNIYIKNNGSLTLTSGVVSTSGTRNVTVLNTTPASVTGYSTGSYIAGNLVRYVAATGSYDFPLGNTDAYELANINITSNTGLSNITANFTNPANATGSGLPLVEGGTYDAVVNCGGTAPTVGNVNGGVWTFTPDAGTATYNMTLYGRNFDNANSSVCTILKRTTAGPGSWGFNGTFGSCAYASGAVVSNRTGLSGFSQFAIGRSNVPLPIELLRFNALPENSNVKLLWTTTSEINNDYFTVERCKSDCYFDNYENWEVVATIDGAGTSNQTLDYTTYDLSPYPGISYYRLKQTDYDGTSKYFSPVAVEFNNVNLQSVNIYPNPNDGSFFISLKGYDINENVHLMLTNSIGSIIFSADVITDDNGDYLGMFKPEFHLSKGVYLLEITTQRSLSNEKIIVR